MSLKFTFLWCHPAPILSAGSAQSGLITFPLYDIIKYPQLLVSLYQWASLAHQNERDQIFSIVKNRWMGQNSGLQFEKKCQNRLPVTTQSQSPLVWPCITNRANGAVLSMFWFIHSHLQLNIYYYNLCDALCLIVVIKHSSSDYILE